MYSVNQDDPLSTAAAAMSLAKLLEPALTAAGRGRRGNAVAAALDCLAHGLEGPDLFEEGTVAALRLRLAEIAADVQRHTAPAVAWLPVRYVDGVEEFEPVNVTRRTPEGDALAAAGARIKTLIALIDRTRTLLAAEAAIGQRR